MSGNMYKIVNKTPNKCFIRKPPKYSPEQEKALRDQFHLEIENKTKLCSNASFDCHRQRLDGYQYCLNHILQDPKAPYKQCAYLYSITNKRCTQAAPKQDSSKKEHGFSHYCFEHSRLSQLKKTKTTVGKFKTIDTSETLLNNLSHHIKLDKARHNSNQYKLSVHDDDEEVVDQLNIPSVDPFIDVDSVAINDSGRKILDYASDTSSDDDTTTVANTWKGFDMDNSDYESIDSDDDVLQHAGIYTADEATSLTLNKLVRLQSLYIDQFQRLQHVLKEKRRKYLQNARREKETMVSIHEQPKDTPKERKLYEKLKALNRYHKRHGVEAILHKKYLEKRAKCSLANPAAVKQTFHYRCIYTEGGVKCGERTLPCSKHCQKHILEDKKQVLFRMCNIDKGGIVCQQPVADILEDATCVLHIDMPNQRSYSKKKYESESEDDEGGSPNSPKSMEQGTNVEIKQEIKYEDQQCTSEIVENNITISHDNDVSMPIGESETNITITH